MSLNSARFAIYFFRAAGRPKNLKKLSGSRFDDFRQTQDQDFASLPDPFASDDPNSAPPQQQIGEKQDEGLDHIEDPDMQSLMQREIAR